MIHLYLPAWYFGKQLQLFFFFLEIICKGLLWVCFLFTSSHRGVVCVQNVAQCVLLRNASQGFTDSDTDLDVWVDFEGQFQVWVEITAFYCLFVFSNSNDTLKLWRYCWLFGRQFSHKLGRLSSRWRHKTSVQSTQAHFGNCKVTQSTLTLTFLTPLLYKTQKHE